MDIGDILYRTPTGRHGDDRQPHALACRVVYIHPDRRFYTVEFRSHITGETYRESFPCQDRQEILREQPQKEPADNHTKFGPASLRRALEKGRL